VANDIRIECNTIGGRKFLDLKHEQYVIAVGLNINIDGIAVTLSYIDPSIQFDGQIESENQYGELAVSWSF